MMAMQDRSTTHTVSAVIGRHVFTADGAYLGDIVDLLLDVDAGRIGFAVVVPGGPFGLDSRWLCIPFQALRHAAEHDCFVLRHARRVLNAPVVGDDVRDLVVRSRLALAGARLSTGSAASSAAPLRRTAANAE
jgi:sporulation protein YlmC with PRC-barrel domain